MAGASAGNAKRIAALLRRMARSGARQVIDVAKTKVLPSTSAAQTPCLSADASWTRPTTADLIGLAAMPNGIRTSVRTLGASLLDRKVSHGAEAA